MLLRRFYFCKTDPTLALFASEEKWLYTDEGYDGDKKTFVKRLNALKETAAPFESRKAEHLGRESCIESLKKTINKYNDIGKNVNTKDEEKYSHLTEEQRKEVNDKCEATRSWLNDILKTQSATAMNVDPVVTMSKLKEERKSVINVCKPIVNTPKPKPTAQEEVDAADAKAKADGEGKKDGEGVEGKEGKTEGEGVKDDDKMDIDEEPEVDLSGKVDDEGDSVMEDTVE